MQFHRGSAWLALDVLTEFSSNATIPYECHYLFWPASTALLSLHIFIQKCHLWPPVHDFCLTVKKTLNMPALINHSTMFLLASNAFSFCLPAFLSSFFAFFFFFFLVHSYCGRTLLLSLFFFFFWMSCVCPTSNDSGRLWGRNELLLNKRERSKD